MKRLCLVEVVLSGASQGLDDAVVLHPLAAVLLKAYALADPDVAARWEIVTINVREDSAPEATTAQIAALEPDVVGFSVYTWNDLHIRAATARLAALCPDAMRVWGGPQVSYDAVERLARFPFVDVVVCGPGEEPLRRLLLGIADGVLPEIPGVARRVDGTPALTGGTCGDDLTRIRSPFQTGLIDLSGPGPHAVYLETFRGCVHACGFCLWGAARDGLDFYPLEQVLEDVRIVYNSPNVVSVYFVDAYLFYHPKRAEAILETIYACKYVHPTFFEFDPRHLRARHVRLVARACGHDYRLGVQTFEGAALAAAGRNGQPGDVERATETIRQEDPQAKISFALIYGLPGDSLDGFRSSIARALRLRADSMKMNVLSVLPGSQYWKDRHQHGLVFQEDPPHRLLASRDFTAQDVAACVSLAAWLHLLMRDSVVKAALHDAAQHGPRALALLDGLIARLRGSLPWVEESASQTGGSVEAENQARLRLLRAGSDPVVRDAVRAALGAEADALGLRWTPPAEDAPPDGEPWLR